MFNPSINHFQQAIRNNGVKKWQWSYDTTEGVPVGFMLNTDFALFYDLKGFMKYKVLLKLVKKCDMKSNLIEYTSDSIVVFLDFCSLI